MPMHMFAFHHIYASVNSKCQHPPQISRQIPEEFVGGGQKPCPRAKFFWKSTANGDKKTPTPREYFERSSQLFLLIGVEILQFCRNQTLQRTGRLSNYSLVIPSSFSLSTILQVSKLSPSFGTDFVTREQQ